MANYSVRSSDCVLYLNGKIFNEVQELSWNIDYGVNSVYGVDSAFPQEITATRASVTGKVVGLKMRKNGGLQGSNIRPQIFDIFNAPYISLRVVDIQSSDDILYIPSIMISKESVQMAAKGVVKISFEFTGIQPLQPLDRIS